MLASLATVDQLEDRLPAGSVDVSRAQAALDDASALVRAEARRSWETVDDIGIDDDQWRADLVVTIVLKAAIRSLTNPEGVESEQVGSYRVGYRSNDVYLTAAERAQVRKAAGDAGVWTLSTTRGDVLETSSGIVDANGTEYLPTSDGSLIPWLAAQ